MWIVDRAKKHVRELSNDEVSLLVGFVRSELAGQEIERANSLLRSIRHDRNWLGCRCCTPMPVLNVALRDNGRLVLRNNPDSSAHVEGCDFERGSTNIGELGRSYSHELSVTSNNSPIALHGEIYDESKGPVGQISRTSAPSARSKPLLSLLLTILDTAGLASYLPGQVPTITEQYARIRNAARRFTLEPGVSMDAVLDTKITRQRLVAMATRLKGADGFGDHRRVGLLIDQVDGVKGRAVLLAGGESMDFFGKVERYSASYPALAICTVTNVKAGSKFFEMANVATVPIVSRSCMFPLVSDQEREPLVEVFGLLDWLRRTKSLEITAWRRPFAVDSHLIELRSKKLVLRIDLVSSLDGNTRDPSSIPVLKLVDSTSIATFKKLLAARFLESANA